MHRLAALTLFLASAPALPQSDIRTPSQKEAARVLSAADGEINTSGSRKFAYDRGGRLDNGALLRAGAWGRCVAAAAPDLSRAYLDTRSPAPALRPVFKTCLRQTGAFTGSSWGEVRRAAISDALARG